MTSKTEKTRSRSANSTASKAQKNAAVTRTKRTRKRDLNPEGLTLFISADERRRMIAEAAYTRAESRGFTAGNEQGDWLEAEKEVDAMLVAAQSDAAAAQSSGRM